MSSGSFPGATGRAGAAQRGGMAGLIYRSCGGNSRAPWKFAYPPPYSCPWGAQNGNTRSKARMAISAEQRAMRAGRIGSSDAPRIMAGRWHEVWLEKTGRTTPPDLDLVPAVQIGLATDALHPRFYAHRTGLPCRPAGERSYVHPQHDFLVAHPDFLTWSTPPASVDDEPDTVLEAKFHAGPKSDEELLERYYW